MRNPIALAGAVVLMAAMMVAAVRVQAARERAYPRAVADQDAL
jgi:hypothetical protein